MDEGSRAVESVNGIRHWILDFQIEESKQAVLRMTPMTGNYSFSQKDEVLMGIGHRA